MWIIRKGTRDKVVEWGDREYIKKCKNCNTIFIYKNKEAKYGYMYDVGKYVTCPNCKAGLDIGLFRKRYKAYIPTHIILTGGDQD